MNSRLRRHNEFSTSRKGASIGVAVMIRPTDFLLSYQAYDRTHDAHTPTLLPISVKGSLHVGALNHGNCDSLKFAALYPLPENAFSC